MIGNPILPAITPDADPRSDLVDQFGRRHRDLRISLTDHCNLRCTYCMPAEGVPWLPKPDLLSTDEIIRVVGIAVAAGIDEVRLTGGEPLLRRDVVDLVAGIAALRPGLDVSMTTNAIGMARLARPLREAGLTRVNISLDTLDRERFKQLARRDRLDDTLAGIAACAEAGFAPIKLNTVLMRGVNDDEAVELTRWAIEHGHEPRFIEQMPLDAGHTWTRAGMVTQAEILARLRSAFDLTPVAGRGAAPAERWLVNGGPATVGVIASVSAPFCGACDRLRLTADGQLRNCLFARGETNLRDVLRSGMDADRVEQRITALFHESLATKRPGHGINNPRFLQPARPMSAIGG